MLIAIVQVVSSPIALSSVLTHLVNGNHDAICEIACSDFRMRYN